MSDVLEVGQKLVELCREGKALEATDALYSHHIVSVEALAGPNQQARTEGIEAVRGRTAWWQTNHEVHKAEVEGPFPHGDRFIVFFKFDVTGKGASPFAGKRQTIDEAALYTVKDGKITHEEFFYTR
jgi:ketosteroid isomerase-like protein